MTSQALRAGWVGARAPHVSWGALSRDSHSISLLPGLTPASRHLVLQATPDVQTTDRAPPSGQCSTLDIESQGSLSPPGNARGRARLERYMRTHVTRVEASGEQRSRAGGTHVFASSAGPAPASALTCHQPLSVAEGPRSARSQGLALVSCPGKLDSGPSLWLPSAQKPREAPSARRHLSRGSVVGGPGPAAGDCWKCLWSGQSSGAQQVRGPRPATPYPGGLVALAEACRAQRPPAHTPHPPESRPAVQAAGPTRLPPASWGVSGAMWARQASPPLPRCCHGQGQACLPGLGGEDPRLLCLGSGPLCHLGLVCL